MNVVCQNTQCIYRNGSGFCVKDFVFLNAGGMCREWWDKNGARKMSNIPFRQDTPPSDKKE